MFDAQARLPRRLPKEGGINTRWNPADICTALFSILLRIMSRNWDWKMGEYEGKRKGKKEEIERNKWWREWRMNTCVLLSWKGNSESRRCFKTKRKMERFFFFHNSRKTAYLPSSFLFFFFFSPRFPSLLLAPPNFVSFSFLTLDGITYTFQVSYYSEPYEKLETCKSVGWLS